MSNKKMTPEEELRDLCDISVVDCVAHVSEFTPGAEYFEPEVADTLIKFLQQTPDLTGVLLDGLTSVHRPGILSDKVVFYNNTEEEMFEHLKKIERHDHVHWMFNEVMKIHDEWLGKFRAALPKIKMVYSIDSDDFHSMCERMLRVIVQSGRVKVIASKKALEKSRKELQNKLDGVGTLKESDLQARLTELQEKRQKQAEDRAQKRVAETDKQIAEVKADIELVQKFTKLDATRKALQKDAVKNKARLEAMEEDADWIKIKSSVNIKEQGLVKTLATLTGERSATPRSKQRARELLDGKIQRCKDDIATTKKKVQEITQQIEALDEQFTDLREPETSPIYQRRVDDHVKQMYRRFHELGKKHNVRIVTKPDVLVFGTMVIDYAHDRGRTWQPMRRVRRLAESHHGLMTDHDQNIRAMLDELGTSVEGVDVVMESGHHGEFLARWQRLNITTEEIRMQHVNSFYTGGSDGVKHVLFLAGMPFEPQDNIGKYLRREKPSRTRGGKPIASASHPVFIRNSKRSVSGMTLIRKHRHGIMSVEAIMYRLFQNKKVLEPFKAVMSQDDSDNHFNSPEMDPLGTLGTLAMNKELMENPLQQYGEQIHIGSTFNLGDTAEAGSQVWKEATKFRKQVMEVVAEIPAKLLATNLDDYESVMQTAIAWANDMMGGSNENMELTMQVVRWFLKEKFLSIYHHSKARLLDILVSLEGNHAANAMSKFTGVQEFTSFKEWLLAVKAMSEDFPELGLKPFPLKIELGGQPHETTLDNTEMVVHLGGYSVARQAVIPEYGMGYNGKLCVQETYRVGLTHEPNAILNKARNMEADVIKAGHTHESYLAIDKSGDNIGRFIDQKPCTQRVSGTELLYGGLPRTAGSDYCVYTRKWRYQKMTVPAQHNRRVGLAQLKIWVKEAIEDKKKIGVAKKK
jgi:hypothetical protein